MREILALKLSLKTFFIKPEFIQLCSETVKLYLRDNCLWLHKDMLRVFTCHWLVQTTSFSLAELIFFHLNSQSIFYYKRFSFCYFSPLKCCFGSVTSTNRLKW